MEQKQIDEIDESYFSEEFIDEDSEKSSEVRKESSDRNKESKADSKKTTRKKTSKSEDKSVKSEAKAEKSEEVKVSSAKEAAPSTLKEPVQAKKPIDPWADEDETEGSGSATTWKALTGIAVILLIISIFTQGFGYNAAVVDNSKTIDLTEAQNVALEFVNNNLLRPPFVATVLSSEEVNDLYKVKISVAGEEVDSYLTKDGELFFPQGFDVTAPSIVPEEPESELEVPVIEEPATEVVEENVEEPEPVESAEEPVSEPIVDELEEVSEVIEEAVEPIVEEAPVEEPVAASRQEFNVEAKRWLFSPQKLTVSQGSLVVLNIAATDLSFTFSIPDLGVEQEVNGAATVEFSADQVGEFEYSCGSCEDWRGMTGTLVVQ